jgi:glycosyltransferase 2 family protein
LTKNTKTALQTIIFLTLGGVLFYYAIGSQDTSSIWLEIRNANKKWILIAIVCGILSHLARALRWNLLLEPLGYSASVAASFHAVILGYLVNMALPRVGEVTRPAVLSRLENIPFNKLMGTVVIERIVDLLITILIAIGIFIIQFGLISDFCMNLYSQMNSNSLLISALVATILIGMGIVAFIKREWFYQLPILTKLKGFVEGLVEGFKTIFNLKRKSQFITYSLFIWVMYFCMPLCIFYALAGTAHLGASAGLTVLLFGTAAMIIPVPGGIGTFEFLVPKALDLYQITGSIASSYTLITHALQFLVIIGVGAFSIAYFVIKTNKKIIKDVE